MNSAQPNRSRRAFLFGARQMRATVQRPPWSLLEAAFVDACTGCGDCLAACPEAILVPDPDRLPVVDFSRGTGACTFCGACADACAASAFLAADRRDGQEPWYWRAAIGERCLTFNGIMCQSCKDACGDGAIAFVHVAGGVARPFLDVECCTGCGACQSPCPVQAISFTPMERADA